mmetsp:Transcript_26247/g.42983  ORF Transcript_26247/g.42983 Transcript_26247/m.42983 type:complete len:286 (+) Transcript_26247:84-941(+)
MRRHYHYGYFILLSLFFINIFAGETVPEKVETVHIRSDFDIEPLFEEKDFRPDWKLTTRDVEDRTYLLPYFLADRINTAHFRRRIYIDLGSATFESSVGWFLRVYPCDFTHMYTFEAGNIFHLPQDKDLGNFMKSSDWRPSHGAPPLHPDAAVVGAMYRDRIKHSRAVVDIEDVDLEGAEHMFGNGLDKVVNITRIMRDEIKLRKEDYVVVKMDIEGSEWFVLPSWLEDNTVDFIDELFVEVHYGDSPTLNRCCGWSRFAPKTRREATQLFNDFRKRGVFAHAWP